MADTQHFKCPNCGESSEYEDRYSVFRMDARTAPTAVAADETRTYTCQRCGQPAKITMNRDGWSLVDGWVRARKSP